MKKMLINATQPEELRVAMVDGQRLYVADPGLPPVELDGQAREAGLLLKRAQQTAKNAQQRFWNT